MENFKNKNNIWNDAIILERTKPHHIFLEENLNYIKNRDNALILGDACKVNSKFLIEHARFNHVDNIDQSSLVVDDYYNSSQLSNFQTFFGSFNYPKNKYDLVYGKSITFTKKEVLPKVLKNIEDSLQSGGFFLSSWNLENTALHAVYLGIWNKDLLIQELKKLDLEIIKLDEIQRSCNSLSGDIGIEHTLKVVMKKN